MVERSKDEELKRFKSHKIEFDFTVLTRIKEGMVDLSSDCIDMVLKVWQPYDLICLILSTNLYIGINSFYFHLVSNLLLIRRMKTINHCLDNLLFLNSC